MMMDKLDWCDVGKWVQVKNYPINKWKVKEVSDDDGVRIECEKTSTWVCRTEIEPFGAEEPSPSSQFANKKHPDHKEGEGVKWEPGVDLPPVGEKVLAYCEGEHFETEVVAHLYDPVGRPTAAFWTPGLTLQGRVASCFGRPQSHRDKVIEAAQKATGVKQKFCGALYDAGMLKLPEGEE